MVDFATPNLPARDYDATAAFYGGLGFEQRYRDAAWMILARGSITLEFFLFREVDPAASSFSCCLRLDDLDTFVEVCRAAGIPDSTQGWPRLHAPRIELSGMRIGHLVDLDGTLLRLVANPPLLPACEYDRSGIRAVRHRSILGARVGEAKVRGTASGRGGALGRAHR